MGVVHLARRPGGERVALKMLRPHIVGDEEARQRLAREVGSLSRVRSKWVAEIVDADPWARHPLRRHPLRPRSLAARPRAGGGADRGRRPAVVRRLPRRGARLGPRGGRAAPRHQAVQRADGGPHPDPHRLRPGAGRRRPQAHPHRLAAGHARLPRARDPVRRERHPRRRRPLLGGHRGLRRHRRAAVRARAVDGDHGPGPPGRARPQRDVRAAARRGRRLPAPRAARATHAGRGPGLAPAADHPARAADGAAADRPPTPIRSPCRWPSPARPPPTTPPGPRPRHPTPS